ncbi:tetratricopeptide repeat protein [Gracilimonas sp. Q87]|uniref:ATP-binding protein n=1 Tax=Gracilimonas sp. Q87 TaxID=3384766 RepID=UPI0039846092
MIYSFNRQIISLFLIIAFTFSFSPKNVQAEVGFISVLQDSVKAEGLLEKSKEASKVGDYDRAMQLAQDAEKLYLIKNDDEGIAKALTYRADILIDQQLPDQAYDIVVDALERFSNTTQVAQFHNILGTTYSLLEEPLKAGEQYNTAMQYLDRLHETEANRLRAGILHNLAVIYRDMGQTEQALKNYLESIDYARSVEDSALLAVAYNNLGLAYSDNEEYEKSKYYLENSLELAKERNSQIDIYRAHLNLANTLGNMGEYEVALTNFDRAQDIISILRPGTDSPIIMHNRGATLAKMERYQEAEDLLFRSLKISEDQAINEGIYYNNFVIGNMYSEQARFEEAIAYLKKAESVAESSYNINLNIEVAKALHEVYAKNDDYENAYNKILKYSALSDSVNKVEKDRELANAENFLELGRQNEINSLLQEKQINQERQLRNQLILIIASLLVIILISVLLYKMKKASHEKEIMYDQLKRQKQELEELNKSKDKLFAIISHDLRSPLMSMQGMLSLIKNDFLTQDEIKEMVPELEASLQENSNVMEDLLAWAKEQLSGVELNLRLIDISDLTEDVLYSQKFIADKKKVDLNSESINVSDVKADFNALSLVVRNLISNAIKFSEPGDRITVSAEELTDHVIIKVKDEGIGIPESAKDKVFENKNWTREGTQNEKGTGFGLSLSKEFVERMNGKIWFESKVGEGTEFFVEIPKSLI